MKQEKMGAFIANLRKEKGWTQKEMASQLGVSDKAVSKWETGKSLPDMGILIPVSELFGVTVDELLSGEKRNTGVIEGNLIEPNKAIIEYATNVINRIKKNYRLIPVALIGIFILSFLVLHSLGFGFNQKPENPLKGIVERNPMNSIGRADMTEEEHALTNFTNGMGTTNYLAYRLSDDKNLSSLGIYMFDGKKWSSYPIITNGDSHSGLISLAVKDGMAEVGLYEADGGSYSAQRLLVGYQKSWTWVSGLSDHPINVSDPGMSIITFWAAGENGDVSMFTYNMFCKTEAEWMAERGKFEGNAYAVAVSVVVK